MRSRSETRAAKMHTTSESSTAVPAFLTKLWTIVDNPLTNNFIFWSPNGKSFIIRNQPEFAKDVLPKYYKHSNMASFIRQLNMYGFHKKISVELGGLKCDRDEIEFAHEFFCKDKPYLLDDIKRKVAGSKNQDSAQPIKQQELMGKMLDEVSNMKGRQENMDSLLSDMKLENGTLWRELAMLRQKHIKQQQIINKLIQFLVTLVQPSRSGLSVKRRYPLMINDSSRPHKRNKLSKPQESPRGPVIHELDASEPDVDSDYIVAEMLENETPTVHSPEEHIEPPTDDENMETIHLIKNPIQNSKIEIKKERVCKGKKKRKNKVPVRILIPSLENGEKSREELHMLEVSTDEDEPVTLLKNKFIGSKPIPMATVRSSKLAAMAANIDKSQDVNMDMDTPTDLEDNMEVLDNAVKLEDILITPEIFNDCNVRKNVENREDRKSNKMNKRLNQMDGGRSVLMTNNNNEQRNENRMVKSSQKENNNYDRASASSSKDLSVSRVNPSGLTEANYRLEPKQEVNSHVETMQNDLDNLRDMLRGENYSIDANAILGLFSTDDPMTFGLPINPELNPNSGKEDNDQMILDSANGSAGGELMAYNPPILDFDDDIFLENPSPSLLSNPSDLQMNNLYTESIDIEDSKISLLDSLVANNMNSKS